MPVGRGQPQAPGQTQLENLGLATFDSSCLLEAPTQREPIPFSRTPNRVRQTNIGRTDHSNTDWNVDRSRLRIRPQTARENGPPGDYRVGKIG